LAHAPHLVDYVADAPHPVGCGGSPRAGAAQLGLVIVMVIGIHMIEAYGLNPAIYSAHLKLHPLLVLTVLVVAEHSLGVWGLLLAGAPARPARRPEGGRAARLAACAARYMVGAHIPCMRSGERRPVREAGPAPWAGLTEPRASRGASRMHAVAEQADLGLAALLSSAWP